MNKKKDGLGSILFWLFFAAVFFGGDAVQLLNLGEQGDPMPYLLILGGVIVLMIVASRLKNFLATAKKLISMPESQGGTQANSTQQLGGVTEYVITGITAETVTGEVVNPLSVSGK